MMTMSNTDQNITLHYYINKRTVLFLLIKSLKALFISTYSCAMATASVIACKISSKY